MNDSNQEPLADFDALFSNSSVDETDRRAARMIMYRFLSEIERTNGTQRGLKKKLATAIGKSKSYVSQLFRGDRVVNLLLLAKFERTLGIKFKIVAYPAAEFEKVLNEPLRNYSVNVFSTTTEGMISSGSISSVQVLPESNPSYS